MSNKTEAPKCIMDKTELAPLANPSRRYYIGLCPVTGPVVIGRADTMLSKAKVCDRMASGPCPMQCIGGHSYWAVDFDDDGKPTIP